MILDLLYLIVLLLALFKGMKKGLVVALFSFVALFVGMVVAMKFSAVVAEYMKGSVEVSARWLPFIAFILIFVGVALLARLVAKIIETAMETMMLGWANKLGGVLLYSITYTLIFSVLIFFLEKLHLLGPSTTGVSQCYRFVKPWGPSVVEGIGSWWPFFKDLI